MVRYHCQVIFPTPYQSRLQETPEPRSLYCRNSKPETSRGRARGRVFIVVAKATNCDNVQNIEERKKMLVDKRLCFNYTGVQVTRRKDENQVRLQIKSEILVLFIRSWL